MFKGDETVLLRMKMFKNIFCWKKDDSYGVHKFVKVNGIKIHYVEAGDRDKPLMMFVHGFPEFWFTWRHQMTHFAKEGYRVVALDLPGYGDSEKPDSLDQYHVKVRVENTKISVVLKEKLKVLTH